MLVIKRQYRRAVNTKFLGSQINNNVNWKNRIEKMIRRLRGTYYAVRLIVYISNINSVKSISGAYFHFVSKYGKILGVNFQKWEENQNYG